MNRPPEKKSRVEAWSAVTIGSLVGRTTIEVPSFRVDVLPAARARAISGSAWWAIASAISPPPGIGPRRAEIIVPGLAVLADFLKAMGQTAMYYSRAGVRDGIIADLAARNVGAELAHLTRDQRREVEDMCRRYGVSLDRASTDPAKPGFQVASR